MSDDRNNEKIWRVILRDIDSAELHFSRSLSLYEEIISADNERDEYRAEMAFQHAMQSGYNSVESAIKRIFHLAGESLPSGASSHRELLIDH